MGTRSRISIQLEDKKYLSSYVHYDGYFKYMRKLLPLYNTEEKVLELINLGWMEIVESSIEGCKKYLYNEKPNVHDTLKNLFIELVDTGDIEYLYIFKGTYWDGIDIYKSMKDIDLEEIKSASLEEFQEFILDNSIKILVL